MAARIDDPTAEADKFGSGKDGFTEGDGSTTVPTRVRSPWLDGIQEAVVRPIENAGETPDPTNYGQFPDVLARWFDDLCLSNWQRYTLPTLTRADAVGWNPSSAAHNWMIFEDEANYTFFFDGEWDAGLNIASAGASNGVDHIFHVPFLDFMVMVGGRILTGSAVTSTRTSRTPGGGFAGGFSGGAANGSVVVIVGDTGEIQTSTDGINWTHRTAAASYAGTWRSVCYSTHLGLFVAVGSAGEIQTSPDGINWTHRTAGSSYANQFDEVHASPDGAVCAFGLDMEIQSSADGITWTRRVGPNTNYDFTAAIHTGVQFVAMLSEDITGRTAKQYRSMDGITWTSYEMSVEFAIHRLAKSPAGALLGIGSPAGTIPGPIEIIHFLHHRVPHKGG